MRYHSNELLAATFEVATYEELTPIFDQLEIIQSESYPSKFLAKKISEVGANSIANIFRDGEATGYLDILNQISSSLGLENIERSQPALIKLDDHEQGHIGTEGMDQIATAIHRLEDAILGNIAQNIHRNLSAEQKAIFDREVSEKLKDFDAAAKAKVIGAGGLLAIGNVGGFATYTTVSSLLHLVSGGLLGFGAYTTASTVISIALGPVGWGVLGLYFLKRVSSPKLKKLLPIALCVTLIRKRHLYG